MLSKAKLSQDSIQTGKRIQERQVKTILFTCTARLPSAIGQLRKNSEPLLTFFKTITVAKVQYETSLTNYLNARLSINSDNQLHKITLFEYICKTDFVDNSNNECMYLPQNALLNS